MAKTKYSSGADIQADIDRLIEMRTAMAEETSEKFTKALLTKPFVDNLLNLNNSQLRDLAKTINRNYDRLMEIVYRREKIKSQKNEHPEERSIPKTQTVSDEEDPKSMTTA